MVCSRFYRKDAENAENGGKISGERVLEYRRFLPRKGFLCALCMIV
jgi:hypothetical protein